MASRNSRSSRSVARSSRSPQSARAVRTAKAAQSGRIAPRNAASDYVQDSQPVGTSSYRPAYTPGSQGNSANSAFSRQTSSSQYSRANPTYSRAAKKKMGRGKKIAIGVVAAILVVIVGAGTASALYINSINQQLTSGDKTTEEIEAIQDVIGTAPASFDEPFYMMLIGSDRREGDDEMGARSDTNIVVRVDPTQNLATMVSIPRDTMIEIDGYGTNKFNAAYNYGGAAAAIREAEQLLNVDISHYAEVNFEELVGLVDAVGGVDVEVDERIDDTDADGSTGIPDAERIIIEEGTQHLDGKSALVFARSRAYVDGDFTRTANQRKLIMALVNKVLAMPVTELPAVIQSAAKCVTTDLSVTDIIGLAQQFKEGGDLTIYSAMVPSTTGYVGEVSYVFTDETSLKEMMKLVEAGEDPSEITASADAYANAASSSSGTSGSSAYGGAGSVSGGTSGGSTYGGTGSTDYYDPNYYYAPSSDSYSGDYAGDYYDGSSTGTYPDSGASYGTYDDSSSTY